MLRPERMSSANIICIQRDLDHLLEALNGFGEFHIEHFGEEGTRVDYSQSVHTVEETLNQLNDMIKQFSIEKLGFTDLFRQDTPQKMKFTAENWHSLAENTRKETLKLWQHAHYLTSSLATLQEETAKI